MSLLCTRRLPEGLAELAELALAPVHRRHDPLLERALSRTDPDRSDHLRECVRNYLLDAVTASLVAGYNAGLAAGATAAAVGRADAFAAGDPG